MKVLPVALGNSCSSKKTNTNFKAGVKINENYNNLVKSGFKLFQDTVQLKIPNMPAIDGATFIRDAGNEIILLVTDEKTRQLGGGLATIKDNEAWLATSGLSYGSIQKLDEITDKSTDNKQKKINEKGLAKSIRECTYDVLLNLLKQHSDVKTVKAYTFSQDSFDFLVDKGFGKDKNVQKGEYNPFSQDKVLELRI